MMPRARRVYPRRATGADAIRLQNAWNEEDRFWESFDVDRSELAALKESYHRLSRSERLRYREMRYEAKVMDEERDARRSSRRFEGDPHPMFGPVGKPSVAPRIGVEEARAIMADVEVALDEKHGEADRRAEKRLAKARRKWTRKVDAEMAELAARRAIDIEIDDPSPVLMPVEPPDPAPEPPTTDPGLAPVRPIRRRRGFEAYSTSFDD